MNYLDKGDPFLKYFAKTTSPLMQRRITIMKKFLTNIGVYLVTCTAIGVCVHYVYMFIKWLLVMLKFIEDLSE